jgi:hypothetical protein
MNKQKNQLIALVALVLGWALYWHFYIKMPHKTVAAKAETAKATKADSLLVQRFHRVRAEMDAMYHYRLKPSPFDASGDPFRIPKGMEDTSDTGTTAAADANPKGLAADTAASGPPPPDYGEKLLKSAVAGMKIGGVVTLNGITQLTVDGALHKEGDEFAAKVLNAKGQPRPILVRIRHLTTSSVTLVLESDGGGAELRVRLN